MSGPIEQLARNIIPEYRMIMKALAGEGIEFAEADSYQIGNFSFQLL
jgi:hypothetical protein